MAGPWLERLPHFRLDGTPSVGDEIQTEYFVDSQRRRAIALRAVRALGRPDRPHLHVTELRTAAADELWLSGAYQRRHARDPLHVEARARGRARAASRDRVGARRLRRATALGQVATGGRRDGSPACTRGSATRGSVRAPRPHRDVLERAPEQAGRASRRTLAK